MRTSSEAPRPEKAADASKAPSAVLPRLVAAVFLAILVPVMIERWFQPLQSRHFLRFADTVETFSPFGYVTGIALALLFGWAGWKVRYRSENQEKLNTITGSLKLAMAPPVLAAFGLFLGTGLVTKGVPLLRHHLAEKTAVEVPFRINGFLRGRPCRGVTASHPLFYDDRLCGVPRDSELRDRIGRTIIVLGQQSPYGLTFERYRFEPSSGLPPAEIRQTLERCILPPRVVPRPFDTIFAIVVGADGRVETARTDGFRSPPTQGDYRVALKMTADLESCDLAQPIPAGTYRLPVIVRN